MSSAAEVFAVFLRLGLTSFGGPTAHLGYFRAEFVTRRGWLGEGAYAELVALCQMLPGPASSQVGFAIGLKRAGLAGAFAAFAGFTAPSAALMIAAAGGLAWADAPLGQALAHGLKLVAVSVVAHAVWSMARALLTTPARWAAAAASAAAAFGSPVWGPPAAVLLTGAAFALGGAASAPAAPVDPGGGRSAWGAAAGLAVLLAGLLATPYAALAAVMAKAGALVFGGGHVVLPLIEAEAAARGWLDPSAFLAGYGAAQALPGPLFAFAAFVGAAEAGLAGALVALAALFAPGFVFLLLALPVWARFTGSRRALGFAAGAGAAVVGVLAAAWGDPVATGGVRTQADAAIALAGFFALLWGRAPTLLIVAAIAAAGAAARLI